MLSFFPQDVLDEILNLIESVSEGFPTYSFIKFGSKLYRQIPMGTNRAPLIADLF